MYKILLFKELKLITRTRIILFYFILGSLFYPFLLFSLLNKTEEQDNYLINTSLFLLSNFAFVGADFYCWSWEGNHYKLFKVKNKIKELIQVKILSVYFRQIIGICCLILPLYFCKYYYYMKFSLLCTISSLGFSTLFSLYLLSLKRTSVNLFDNKTFIMKQNFISYAVLLLFLLQSIAYSYAVIKFHFIKILLVALVINITLLILFYNKIIKAIEKNIKNDIN